MIGRPSKCTEEIADLFAQYIATCIYVEPAAALCGISARTAYNWLDRGEAEYHRVEANPRASVTKEEAAYFYFFQTVTRARAQVEAKLAGEAILAAQAHHARKDRDGNVYDFQGDGAQALAVLKHAFPDRWGQRKSDVRVTVDDSAASKARSLLGLKGNATGD